MKASDLDGVRFGRLLVIARSESKNWHAKWLCKCDCGTEKIIYATHLKKGSAVSCGCFAAEQASARKRKHGMYGTREHRIWRAMIERCSSANPRYGGRGIEVCDRWLESFESFFEDMGQCPAGYSIDRIDTHGNYEPANCRWASDKEQQNNRSNNRLIEIEGRTQTLAQWADEYGIPQWKFRNMVESGRHVI